MTYTKLQDLQFFKDVVVRVISSWDMFLTMTYAKMQDLRF